jgi:hypothetical protein
MQERDKIGDLLIPPFQPQFRLLTQSRRPFDHRHPQTLVVPGILDGQHRLVVPGPGRIQPHHFRIYPRDSAQNIHLATQRDLMLIEPIKISLRHEHPRIADIFPLDSDSGSAMQITGHDTAGRDPRGCRYTFTNKTPAIIFHNGFFSVCTTTLDNAIPL